MDRIARMKVWNVDLGLAVHVQAPNGKHIVVDLGSSSSVSPLSALWLRPIEYLVITHPHQDHISDINNIIFRKPNILWHANAYTKAELLALSNTPTMKQYIALCEGYGGALQPQNDPANGILFHGMTVRTFQATKCDKSIINNTSAVVVAQLGTAKVVICGDNQKESLRELMQDPEFVAAAQGALILVAPHHGRETGYLEEFVRKVSPLITIISDTAKGETSVADKYSNLSIGYGVFDGQTREMTQRKCLTTRNDGNIEVIFGYDDRNSNRLLQVTRRAN